MHMKKRIISAFLASALLLPCTYSLSADDGSGEYDPYHWESTSAEDASRRMSDYTGAGMSIAVIDAGFDVTHPVFATSPAEGQIDRQTVARLYGEKYYISEKIPFVYDYTDGDENVENISMHGTSAASIAAGFYMGAGDIRNEDGTVTHEASFYGTAPDAQLLLLKAAADGSAKIDADAAAGAVLDALRLGASAIVLHTYGLTPDEELQSALDAAHALGVPVFAGAGDVSADGIMQDVSVLYTDRSTLSDGADLNRITLIGATGDPYRNIRSFTVQIEGQDPMTVAYTDSCEEYFGVTFAEYFAGREIPVVWIEGVGRAEDYKGIDAEGKLAAVKRGDISFVEKSRNAAEAGALGVIVIDGGDGVSRMALEDAPIPAVMIDAEAGKPFADSGAVRVLFREGKKGMATFSAAGMNGSLTNTVAFVCDGEGIAAAVSAALSGNGNFTEVSGTAYAAAAAAGYAARCAQYCRRVGLGMADVLPILTQSAAPLADEDGDPLSPRTAGAGYVHGECQFPEIYLLNEDNAAVSACGNTPYWTTYIDLRVRNTTDHTKTYRISAAVFGDGWVEKDGIRILSGDIDPLTDTEVYLGDSHRNIHSAAKEYYTPTLTLDPGEEAALYVRVSLPKSVREAQSEVFAYGYYVDGFVALTDEDGTSVSHPFTAFYGDWAAAPLIDATVYDADPAILEKSALYIRDGDNGELMIGVDNPARFPGQIYGSVYNLFRADGSTLALSLSALRDIDRIDVTFTDSEDRCVFSKTVDDVRRRGQEIHKIDLWDFIAEDNGEYVFPDGTYTCEIRVAASFGELGTAENTMKFSVTLDSVRPDVVSYSIGKEENGTPFLTVTAKDDTRLASVFAYDGAYSYIPAEGIWGFTDTEFATARMDLSQYDYLDPLYIEVSDYAGNKTLLRIPPETVRDALDEWES